MAKGKDRGKDQAMKQYRLGLKKKEKEGNAVRERVKRMEKERNNLRK